MKKRYEIEVNRNNVTPREFYNYCKKRFEEKSPTVLESWVEYEDWANPIVPKDYTYNKHLEWEKPLIEASKVNPYEFQVFLQNTYNFIIEFKFDGYNRGHGYMYVVEFE